MQRSTTPKLFHIDSQLADRLSEAAFQLVGNTQLRDKFFPEAAAPAPSALPPDLQAAADDVAAGGGLFLTTDDYKEFCAKFNLPYNPNLRGVRFLNSHFTKPGFDLKAIEERAHMRRQQASEYRRLTQYQRRAARITHTAIVSKALDEFLTRVETEINAASKPAASARGNARKAKAK